MHPFLLGPGAKRRGLLAGLIIATMFLLVGCGSATAFGSEGAAAPPGAGQMRTAVAVRTATAQAAATAEALAAAERQSAEGTAQAVRRATVSAQVYLVETTSAQRALRQTADALATAAAVPTPRPTNTPRPADPQPAPAQPQPAPAAPQAQPPQLRFVKLNEDDDPSCITVAVRGISASGWSFRVDGTRVAGSFDRAGNARACGLAPRQEVTLTVFDANRRPVRGGRGVPSRGSAIMQGAWR